MIFSWAAFLYASVNEFHPYFYKRTCISTSLLLRNAHIKNQIPTLFLFSLLVLTLTLSLMPLGKYHSLEFQTFHKNDNNNISSLNISKNYCEDQTK